MAARGIIGSQESQESTKTVVPVRLEAHHKEEEAPESPKVVVCGKRKRAHYNRPVKCGRFQSPAPELPSVRELIRQRSLSRSISENPPEDVDDTGIQRESQRVINSMLTVEDEESIDPSQVDKEVVESPKACIERERTKSHKCQDQTLEVETCLVVGEAKPEGDECNRDVNASTSERVEGGEEEEKHPKTANKAPECCAVASSTWFKCMGGLLKCNAVIVCTAENYAKRLEQAARHDKDRGIWNLLGFEMTERALWSFSLFMAAKAHGRRLVLGDLRSMLIVIGEDWEMENLEQLNECLPHYVM